MQLVWNFFCGGRLRIEQATVQTVSENVPTWQNHLLGANDFAVFDSNKIIAPSIAYQLSQISCHINCMHIGYVSMQDQLKKYVCNDCKYFSQSDAQIRCGCIFQVFTVFLSHFLLY
jgi:hypothetical protein